MTASFQSELRRQMSNDEMSLTESLEKLQPTTRTRQFSHNSSSSGLGKSPNNSNSSHNSSFESKPTMNHLIKQAEETTAFMLVGQRKSYHKNANNAQAVEETMSKRFNSNSIGDENVSRKRFEEARLQIVQKLQLKIPENYWNEEYNKKFEFMTE